MKPNILIVMADQQRADLRKSESYLLDTMPFLDQFASENTDFCSAYTPNPTCMPARTSMFTGRYPSCHHVRTNHNAADAYYWQDLLDTLRLAGYETALCGKNHSQHEITDFSFYETNGHDGVEDDHPITDDEKSLDDFLKSLRHRESYSPSPYSVKEQQPYRNVSSALKFLDQRDESRPFFAWVSFAEPHNPYQVPAPYFDLFPPKDLPNIHATMEQSDEKGPRFHWLRERWKEAFPGEDLETITLRSRSNYLGMLRLIDDQFKRLIEGVRERNLYENTIILYVSDHGDYGGEYGLIRKGADLPELLTRIPMVWHIPGVKAQGKKKGVFVNLVDVFPTLCDLLDLPIPFGVQGKSILPLLTDGPVPSKEYETAYSESGFSGLYWNEKDKLDLHEEGAYNPWCTFDELNSWTQCGQVRMARKGTMKIQMDMMGNGYLYDLSKDPFEVHNLWDHPDYLSQKQEMMTVLIAEILKASDPLPAPRSRYRTKVHPKGYWYDEDFVANDPGIRLPPCNNK